MTSAGSRCIVADGAQFAMITVVATGGPRLLEVQARVLGRDLAGEIPELPAIEPR